jgi:quercetin dioxygenase-like cupin family protein
MSRREFTAAGAALFDLASVDRQMRLEEAYTRQGHTARTLVRERDLRIVLVVMKAAARIAEHHAKATVSIHALSGHLRLHIPNRVVELPAGQLLVLEGGQRHDVEAVLESALLLTLGFSQGSAP